MANLLSRAPRPGQSRSTAPKWPRCGASTDVPAKPGKTAVEMFQAAADGEIKALWIACTNPAQSMPDQATVRRALRARRVRRACRRPSPPPPPRAYADLLLPATTWGEKDGTVTNSERRISRVRAAVPAPGEARARLGASPSTSRGGWTALLPARRIDGARCSPTTTPEAIWNEHRESTRGRDLDITGLSYAMLDTPARSSGRCPRAQRSGARAPVRRRRLPHRRRPRAVRRRAPYSPVAEPRDARYPFVADHRPPARPVARHEPHRHAGPPVRPRGRARRSRCTRRTWRAAAAATATWCTCSRAAARIVLPVQRQRRRSRRRRPSSPCTGARSTSAAAAPAAAGRRQRAHHAGLLPAVASSPS